MTRQEAHNATMTMVFARLQAEGKDIDAMSKEELHPYVADAVEDLKLALDVTGETVE